MYLQIIDDLRQHCREHLSFKELAIRLNWSEAQLAAFFSHKDTSLDSLVKVGFAMDLNIDIVFKPAAPPDNT